MPANVPLVVSVGPCIYWLIFFAIGTYYSDKPREYSLWIPICLLAIGSITQIFEYQILVDLGKFGIGIKLTTSWIYSTGEVLILISDVAERKYKENKVFSIIRTIGNNSFGIYLVHMLLLIPICRFISNCWIVDWILTVICSQALIVIFQNIFPKLSNNYLGFKQ